MHKPLIGSFGAGTATAKRLCNLGAFAAGVAVLLAAMASPAYAIIVFNGLMVNGTTVEGKPAAGTLKTFDASLLEVRQIQLPALGAK